MATENIYTSTPSNTNFLAPNKFIFTFPKLKVSNYNVQSVGIPGVSTNAVQIPTIFNPTFRHGDQLNYEQLTATFLCDEDLRAWEEIYNWLRALTAPTRFAEYIRNLGFGDNIKNPYSDAQLVILTNSNNRNITFTFKDCHPIALSGLNLSSASSPDATLSFDATFAYDYYEISR